MRQWTVMLWVWKTRVPRGQAERPDETTDALLSSARRLFAERGRSPRRQRRFTTSTPMLALDFKPDLAGVPAGGLDLLVEAFVVDLVAADVDEMVARRWRVERRTDRLLIMAKLALERMFDNTDDVLAKTDNPLHRKILINWRRHSCLEIMGRYQEIFAADLTVAHPVYRVHTDGSGTVVLDGREAVEGFYRDLTAAGASVMVGTDDHIAVADWGFTIESHFTNFVPGTVLAAMGMEVDDQAAMYAISYPQAMVWHYTEDGLLIGENIYGGTKTISKPDPAEVITLADAVEILTPILEATPSR